MTASKSTGSKLTPPDEIVKGYKATDANMRCRGYQFELGKWHVHEGDIALCESGFHFCEYPSGPLAFYSAEETRIFKVEAKRVIRSSGPGADLKHVAFEIRLVGEVVIAGDRNTGGLNTGCYNTGYCNTGYYNTGGLNTGGYNTGYCNTGYYNTGDYNTGYYNTGDRNTGDRNTGGYNTGHRNTGYYNTGDYNTGYYNTGDRNTGDRNTGGYNTGHRNTGDSNTGNSNTGNSNTGEGNATDNCSGFFCVKEQPFIIFDKKANKDDVDMSMVHRLSEKLMSDELFNYSEFISLPNSTVAKIKKLHKAHIERRIKRSKL